MLNRGGRRELSSGLVSITPIIAINLLYTSIKQQLLEMKILIIGKNSYIGNHIDKWLSEKNNEVHQLDVQSEDWASFDYAPYDTIVHVAGIVHRPDCNDWDLYKRVNTDMPVAIATMAKEQGVKTYVFFSTMGVYGVQKGLVPTIVDENTPLAPDSMYGKSKLMAEKGLLELQDTTFDVACVRPPSVYGKGCKGGYIRGFKSIAEKLPVIPEAYTGVKQSMLYIDNLAELVYQIIEHRLQGTFCPQDDRSVSANEILSAITRSLGRRPLSSKMLGAVVRLFSFIPLIKKAYGGIEYAKSLSVIKGIDYIVVPFDEGMRRTVSP